MSCVRVSDPCVRESRCRAAGIAPAIPLNDQPQPAKELAMSTIHFHYKTTSTPEQFVAGLTDFGIRAIEARSGVAREDSASCAS